MRMPPPATIKFAMSLPACNKGINLLMMALKCGKAAFKCGYVELTQSEGEVVARAVVKMSSSETEQYLTGTNLEEAFISNGHKSSKQVVCYPCISVCLFAARGKSVAHHQVAAQTKQPAYKK